MYGWICKRHSMDSRIRRFIEAPWAGGAVLLLSNETPGYFLGKSVSCAFKDCGVA